MTPYPDTYTAHDYVSDHMRVRQSDSGIGYRLELLDADMTPFLSSPAMPRGDAWKLQNNVRESMAALVTAAVSQEAHR